MEKIKFILLCIFLCSGIFSCKKYPEGGNTYFAKSKIEGFWDVESLMVGGIDSTVNIKASPCYCEYPFRFEDNSDHDDYLLIIAPNCGKGANSGEWDLSKNKKLLTINFNKDTIHGELFPIILNENIVLEWEIEKLTDKTLWLKTNLNSKEYYIKLNKKPSQ